MSNELIDAMQMGAAKAVPLLKVMAHEKRLIILCCLMDEEMAVGPLSEKVGLKQATLSQHLQVLRHMGYVSTRRDGQTIYYKLLNKEADRIINLLHELYCPENQKG
jgi:DNA-binding transcriptional ArsR family regulator